MKRRWIVLTLAMLALALGLSHPTRVLADDAGWTESQQRFVFDANITNACSDNAENVHLAGFAEILNLTRVDADGTIETKEQDFFYGDGTGATSGARYTFLERGSINESFGPNPDGLSFSY